MKSVIHIITPCVSQELRGKNDFAGCERDDLKLTYSSLERGPASIESEYDEALCVPDTIRRAIEAERAGASAIVIDCMGDPGLNACREAVSIPVLGPCQTALHFATMLGTRFSIITVLERLRGVLDRLVSGYGLKDRYASFDAVNVPVLDIGHDVNELGRALGGKAIRAVRDDHAGSIILGCTGFAGLAEVVYDALREQGLGVPVIDAMPLTIRVADALVKSGLSHSKLVFPTPDQKTVVGYPAPGREP